MNGKFNLSEWALKHQSFVWYLMFMAVVAGIFSYMNLGRAEDPSFAIKTMVIQTRWPGATVDETRLQITDRIEKSSKSWTRWTTCKAIPDPASPRSSCSSRTPPRPMPSPISGMKCAKRSATSSAISPGHSRPRVRRRVRGCARTIFAFTGDGFTMRQLRDYVEQVRTGIRDAPNRGKVMTIGEQDETFDPELFRPANWRPWASTEQRVLESLQAQNAVTPAGVIEAGPERMSVRTSGQFHSVEDLEAVNLRVNDRFYRLADIAEISRGYVDLSAPMFHYNGKPAIGLAIAMIDGGNIQEFGKQLQQRIDDLTAELPVGVGVHMVSDQAQVVEVAVGGFTSALFEAVVIVLAVSFLSLGLRAGLVVAISIPLVLALVFVFMEFTGIAMQRVSLGALIIALGLLVDDAMITVEMMITRLELGETKEQAATFAYHSTAFPMLTGTLVTVAGFVPIGLNNSSAGEYTFTLFAVIAVAMLVSWVVAVLFAPVLGVHILSAKVKPKSEEPGRLARDLR